MKLYVITLFIICVVNGSILDPDREWREWKTLHGKSYKSEGEEQYRRGIWQQNRNYVEIHRNRAEVTFTVELNHLADQVLSNKKDRDMKLEWSPEVKLEEMHKNSIEQPPPPPSFDWRTKGVISAVRDQSKMGSVVAIAATECVESLHAIQNKDNLELLSSHEVADCCPTELLSGAVFQCIHNIGGICDITTYPISSGTCRNSTCTPAAKIGGGASVPRGREDVLMGTVLSQPVMAGIDASHSSFQMYSGGIYNDPQCSQTKIDHAVQVIGYGTMNGQDYWIIKNSWGESWGMNGYAHLARNKNMCGIATEASYPYPLGQGFK